MDISRRGFLGLAAGVVVTPDFQILHSVTVIQYLREKKVRFTTEYFPEKKAFLITGIELNGTIFRSLHLTFEIVDTNTKEGIFPQGRRDCVETVSFFPSCQHLRWWEDGGCIGNI